MQFSHIDAVTAIHIIGASLSFGVGLAYAWMHVVLSFMTRPRLSSTLVCCLRVSFAVVHTAMFLFSILIQWLLCAFVSLRKIFYVFASQHYPRRRYVFRVVRPFVCPVRYCYHDIS